MRCKSASDRDLLALATEARSQAKTARTLLVNARFDIALAADADGVHLPASGLPIDRVRGAFARSAHRPLLIGRSTHTADEVRRAREEGADFVLFGPVFETPSKAGLIPARGLEGLKAAIACGLPVLALGGIDASNADQVLACGAWGLAAIRWFENPAAGRLDYSAFRARWEEA